MSNINQEEEKAIDMGCAVIEFEYNGKPCINIISEKSEIPDGLSIDNTTAFEWSNERDWKLTAVYEGNTYEMGYNYRRKVTAI